MNRNYRIYILACLFSLAILFNAPSFAKDSPLEQLLPLVGGTWKVEAEWQNGQTFKQEVVYEWALNQKLLKVKTYGTVNQETGEYGLRNEGIRAWDPEAGKILFWEFDIFGGITSGECIVENGAFHFQYSYKINNADRMMRDSWTPIDENTYKYEVVMQENGEWSKVLLSEEMKRIIN